ncbi:MAG TPA: class I SAM-dependent methyltransferase [Candidatus Dojkabacteria bacterium]|nr:class I SAM-dependent methyltransferase [Candidatus Dojkabacteria bacterium]
MNEKFDTDKNQDYRQNYNKYFSHLRNKRITLLELGVYKGGSLLMWGEYFKKGNIIGVDINNIDLKLPKNVHMEVGDQRDKEFLHNLSEKYTEDGFDIIIDDASHYANFTEASFLICFNQLLKPGGIYVIEDWGTGYWEDWPDGEIYKPSKEHLIHKLRKEYRGGKEYEAPKKKVYENHSLGMVGLVKQLIDELAIQDIKHSNKELENAITGITGIFYSLGQVFIFKK